MASHPHIISFEINILGISRLWNTCDTIAVGQQGQVLSPPVEPKGCFKTSPFPWAGSSLPTHWLFAGSEAALLAVRAIALVCSGMILIREVAVAPVIMGIPKSAALKFHNEEVR